MRRDLSFLKRPVYSAIVFFTTLAVLSLGYAAVVWTNMSDVISGGPLTSTAWNNLLGNMEYLSGQVVGKASLGSPNLTGTPTAPTAASGTNTTQIATTAFVQSAMSGGSTDFKTIMNASANYVYSLNGLWGTEHPPLTYHYTNTSSACGGYPGYPGYPSCPTGWTSMGTRQSQYSGWPGCSCGEFGCSDTYYRTSQRYCKLTW